MKCKYLYFRKSTARALSVIVFIMALILIVPQVSVAAQTAGQPGAIFRMPAGAWASGMGGAVSADPEFMLAWYNPSALPLLRERRASFGAGLRSLGRTEGWGSYDFRVPPRVGMGMALVYRGDPFISDLYDGYYSGNGGVVEERPLNGAAWSAVSFKIGAGYLVSRRLTVGGSMAINYQSLPTAPDADGTIHTSTVSSPGALDIAATYKLTPDLTLSASIKNLLARNSWQLFTFEAFSPMVDEVVPTVFAFGSSHKTKLLERELVWNADAGLHFFDGEGGYIGRPEMTLAVGARWNFTDEITLRAGIGDMEFSGDLWRNGEHFRDGFSPRVTAGFSYGLSKWMKGATFNYTLMTDRVWAGVDQQFDLTVSF